MVYWKKKKNYRVVVVADGGRSRVAYVSLLLNGNLELGFQAKRTPDFSPDKRQRWGTRILLSHIFKPSLW